MARRSVHVCAAARSFLTSSAVTVNNVAPTGRLTNTGPVNENTPVTVALVERDNQELARMMERRQQMAESVVMLARVEIGHPFHCYHASNSAPAKALPLRPVELVHPVLVALAARTS